ncbi:hypothetical protein KBU80_003645 [Salmonella enterica subsp. enterica serovar Indiana]|nr:hypothetical protein [Salmonella enterica subsp. enterica serovar Indiana]
MCPTAISMNAYVLRIHILPYVVELCSESVLTRHPDTGLARLPQCQSGLWTSGRKISLFEMVAGNDACGKYVYSKAFCPTGKLLISGGYLLSKWSGGSGWNSPDLSMPSAPENAWQIYSGGGVTGGTCMRAIAWCAKN